MFTHWDHVLLHGCYSFVFTVDLQSNMMMMMMMMMLMMNCFGGMVDRWKVLSSTSSQSKILTIANLPHAARRTWTWTEPDSGFVEWSCTVVITTVSQCCLLGNSYAISKDYIALNIKVKIKIWIIRFLRYNYFWLRGKAAAKSFLYRRD